MDSLRDVNSSGSRKLSSKTGERLHGNSNKGADQAEICGSLSTLPAFHGSKDERLSSGHHHHQQPTQSLQVYGHVTTAFLILCLVRWANQIPKSSSIVEYSSLLPWLSPRHLAMWTVQTALKTGPPGHIPILHYFSSLWLEDYVTSCTALFLEQDLYCLATSHGSV